jgi:osmotically-inducible protein OsmY
VESLVGVRSLINNIRVKNRVSAVNVKEQISEALMRHAVLDSENIVVEVQGDMITLSGKVRSWAEWKDAERTAWASPGIVEVENRLEIDPQMKKD